MPTSPTSGPETAVSSPRVSRPFRLPAPVFIRPCAVGVVSLLGWELAVRATRNDLFPGPWQVVLRIVELMRKGLLLK